MGTNLNTWILAISALITAITPILLYIMQYRQKVAFAEQTIAMEGSRLAAVAAAERADEVRATLAESGVAIDKKLSGLNDQNNGERTKMMDRLEEMHREVLRLTVKNNAQTVQLERQDAVEKSPTRG